MLVTLQLWVVITFCLSPIFVIYSLSLLIIIPQTTWHNSLLVTSPTTPTPGITSKCQGTFDSFKDSISFAGASLWNSLPQNIKSCISVRCFKRNLHKYMSENNLSSNLYAHERNLILMFLHICRNCETALISCLIVLIILFVVLSCLFVFVV